MSMQIGPWVANYKCDSDSMPMRVDVVNTGSIGISISSDEITMFQSHPSEVISYYPLSGTATLEEECARLRALLQIQDEGFKEELSTVKEEAANNLAMAHGVNKGVKEIALNNAEMRKLMKKMAAVIGVNSGRCLASCRKMFECDQNSCVLRQQLRQFDIRGNDA